MPNNGELTPQEAKGLQQIIDEAIPDSKMRCFDKYGEPISQGTLYALMHTPGYSRIAQDTIGKITVMTSWVGGDGMDKDYPGEPMIFETLLEGAEIPFWSIMDLGPRRYPTQSRARSSHSHIVEALRGWQEILTPAPEFGE